MSFTAAETLYSLPDSAYTFAPPPSGAHTVNLTVGTATLSCDSFPNSRAGHSGYFWQCIQGLARAATTPC